MRLLIPALSVAVTISLAAMSGGVTGITALAHIAKCDAISLRIAAHRKWKTDETIRGSRKQLDYVDDQTIVVQSDNFDLMKRRHAR